MNTTYSRKTYIQDIFLELPDYKFHHKPFKQYDRENFKFIARKEICDQFTESLVSGTNNGAYLVTGYRGMGKTSFVNKVLLNYRNKLKRMPRNKRGKLRTVYINLAQSSISHENVLKQIIVTLQNNVLSPVHKLALSLVKRSHIFSLSVLVYFIFFFLFIYPTGNSDQLPSIIKNKFLSDIIKPRSTNGESILVRYILFPAALSFLFSFLFLSLARLITSISPTVRIFNRLTRLYARISSEITEEESVSSVVKDLNFGFFSKSGTKYPPLSVKEAEHLLVEIINNIDRTNDRNTTLWKAIIFRIDNVITLLLTFCRYYRRNVYVYVFDEMDKIENTSLIDETSDSVDNSKNYIEDYRNKKELMLSIIASMKYMISQSNARFIFIAGREMFEASLADIADRQYSIGSIFHKVIYVDSFLKDSIGKDHNLSNVIENYLKNILLPRAFIEQCGEQKNDSFFALYRKYLESDLICNCISKENQYKVICALQQFVVYLTYRSNGSPKKITKLIEDLIKSEEQASATMQINVSMKYKKSRIDKKRLYLHISYTNQFRFGFITYLYRPFLLTYNKRIKNYSDYLLVSTTFLLDHILKYHPFAFSSKNLELMPEVLSTSRSPQLRIFIDDLLLFLSYSYIRETEINLFEYKFFNKISNEILYLTNLFEEESAAFNFTLDESLAIKRHIRDKILELRNIHKDFKSNNYEFIHSISSLNNLLGDLRYFDQEYTDAITAYSDALQALRSINLPFTSRIEIVLLIVQLQLKLGLTFEKIKYYENSIAYFTDAMEYSRSTFSELTHEERATTLSIKEFLQIAIHSFIANMFLIEKVNPQGIDLEVIFKTWKIVEPMLNSVKDFTIKAGFWQNTATLLFYKNLSLNKFDEYPFIFQNISLEKRDSMPYLDGSGKDYRFSNVALYFNAVALNDLIQYYYTLNKEASKLSEFLQLDFITGTVARALEIIIADSFEMTVNKSLLKNIALLLAKISDILLTALDVTIGDLNSRRKILFHEIIPTDIFSILNRKDLDFFTARKDLFIPLARILKNGTSNSYTDRLRLILLCYYCSGKYFSLSARIVNCSYQYRRIFRTIISVVTVDDCKKEANEEILTFLEKNLLHEVLFNTSVNTNGTDRAQILKFKDAFDIKSLYNPIEFSRSIYNNLSNNPEIREIILLFAELRLKVNQISPTHVVGDLMDLLPEQDIVNPNNSVASQWGRIMELNFQVKLNKKIKLEYINPLLQVLFPLVDGDTLNKQTKSVFTEWRLTFFPIYSRLTEKQIELSKKNRKILSGDKDVEEEQENVREDIYQLRRFFKRLPDQLTDEQLNLLDQFRDIVASTIHCVSHMIDIIQIYGINYPVSHSLMADTYRHFAYWMEHYYILHELESIFEVVKKKGILKNEIELLIGSENFKLVEPYTLRHSAQLYYRRSLDFHHEGVSYRTFIQPLNYLDDDFNDSMTHFAMALERQRVNSGNIRYHIDKLYQRLKDSQLFKYETYVGN